MRSLHELRRFCLVGLPISVVLTGDAPSTGLPLSIRSGVPTATVEGRVEVSAALTARRARFRIYAEPGRSAAPRSPDAADDERRNIVVYIERAPSAAVIPAKPATLRQQGERFLPHVLPIVRGTTVAFPNEDPLFHNVFSLSRARTFNLGRFPRGESRAVRFDKAGIVKVFCDIHSHMAASVIVFNHPWFTVPDAGGTFEIDDLPAGNQQITAWHERLGDTTMRVRIEPGRAASVEFVLPVPAR